MGGWPVDTSKDEMRGKYSTIHILQFAGNWVILKHISGSC
jgi:hypothetical protein